MFGAAQTVRSFQVTATDDNDNDDGESIDIGFGTLPQAVSAGSPAIATVQLEDDDGPVALYRVRFDASSSLVRTLNEGGCSWVGAALNREADPALVLPLVATPRRGATAADYSDLPANLVFEAGETRSGFSVCGVDDTEEDPGEGLVVRFGTLPAGVAAADGKDAATFDIVDNDGPPGVSIGDASVRERLGSTYSRLIFTLTLDRRADVESSVRWRTGDGTATAGEDYEAAEGTATFRSGKKWVQIAVQTIFDEVAEGEETMTVVAVGSAGAAHRGRHRHRDDSRRARHLRGGGRIRVRRAADAALRRAAGRRFDAGPEGLGGARRIRCGCADVGRDRGCGDGHGRDADAAPAGAAR